MRTFPKFAIMVAMLAGGAAPVLAADKMVPEEGAVELLLLRQKSVRDELKLSDNEAQKINAHSMQQWKKAQEISKLGEKERDAKFIELTKENDHFLDTTLTKDQRKRLQEIELQVAGLLCVTRSHIASKLKLTEEQKKRAAQLQKEARAEMEELIHSDRKDVQQKELTALRETSRKRLLELLTDDQEATWKEMIGKPFNGEFVFFAKN